MKKRLTKHAIIFTRLFLTVMIMQIVTSGAATANSSKLQLKKVEEFKLSLFVSEEKVGKVFKMIEKNSGYNFIYSPKAIKNLPLLSIESNEKSVYDILSDISTQTNLTFKSIDTNIYVKTAEEKMNQTQQERTVSGTVTDQNGEQLPGVTVSIAGTQIGTTTDIQGFFKLEAPDNASLIFSYMGFLTQRIEIGNQSIISVTLVEDVNQLSEVVVVGFGAQKKDHLTGAVSSVKMNEKIADRPVTSTGLALQGAVPGLQVTNSSGQPGRLGLDFNIRGFNSINGGQPLVIVDNIPVDINDINPLDIETITVLKDASSSAIYGARAAFGVILITTKKGAKQEGITFNYSSTIGTSVATEIPQVATPLQFVQALNDFGVDSYWALGQNTQKWLGFIQDYNANPSQFPDGVVMDGGIPYQLRQSDVIGEFLNNRGVSQIHNLNFSGGTDRTTYRVSLGYNNEDGIMVSNRDTFKKYILNTFISSQLSKKLTAELSSNYVKNDGSFPVADYSSAIRQGISVFPTGDYINSEGASIPFATPKNRVLYNTPTTQEDDNIRMSGRMIFRPVKGLSVIGEYTFENKSSNLINVNNDPLFALSSNLAPTGGIASNTLYRKSTSASNYHAVNLFANYKKSINNHNLGFLLGYNYEDLRFSNIRAQRTTLINTNLPSISTATGTLDVVDSFYEWAVMGVFGRFDYNFKEKYFFEFNGRYDGSSRFPENSKFGFFPSVSGGWNISREGFMESSNFISLLKLRASWGEIGNQVTNGFYPAIPGMPVSRAFWINPGSGQRHIGVSSPALVSSSFTWETVRTLNLGIDLAVLEDRLTLGMDWYKRNTLDMIAPGSELPAILGTTAPVANVADLETKGWELDLSWRDRINKFSYQIGFNLFDNQTIITNFSNEAGLLNQYYNGQKIGEIWGFVTDGFYTVNDFAPGSLNPNLLNGTLNEGVVRFQGINPNPGDVKYKDLNGDGIIFTGNNTLEDPGDRQIIGNNTRRFQYGINGRMSYSNVDFSFIVQGVGSRDIWLDNDIYWPFIEQFDNVFQHQLNYWTPNNVDAFYPRNYPVNNINYNNSRRVQTKYLSDGSFWSIRNVTIGYTVPQSILNNIFVNNLRLAFSAENLLLSSNLPKGMHPEFGNQGRGAAYPFMKTYAFTINLTF